VDERIAEWAASGAMALTGRAGRPPLGPPAPLVERLHRFVEPLAGGAPAVVADPLALLAERAALFGLRRHGARSCGGGTRLVRARDGWFGVTLARGDDVGAVPAWLELDGALDDPWSAVEEQAARRGAVELVERAALIGLPVAVLGERTRPPAPPSVFGELPVRAHDCGAAIGPRPEQPLVVDLTSLWAGPLCGQLLSLCGAQVIKVESLNRPDGARRGPAAFYDLLNAGKRSVALDFGTDDGITALHRLVRAADVVLEASRPRALQQLGIDADAVLEAGDGPRVWVSITGHGRDGPGANRVAFGDDAAVAGGLVVWDEDGPCFCADAVADPVAGLVAASATELALASGRRWLIDVAMSAAAAALAGPTLPVPADVEVAAPRARTPDGLAAPFGADTAAVLEALR